MVPASVPLREPLPGGRAGATVTVEPLLTGLLHGPPGFFERVPGPLGRLRALGVGVPRARWWWVPAPAFLLRHPGAGAILVDAGLHSTIADRPASNLGRAGAVIFRARSREDQSAARQLAARGIGPEDLAAIVLTHLHFDHASGLAELPPAPAIVGAAEWRAATMAKVPLLAGYRPDHLAHPRDWRLVDLEGSLAAPHGGFAHSVDLLGDGSVRLLSTPGHTPGHCSILCRLGQGEVLLAGDATYTLAQLAPGGPEPSFPADRRRWHASISQLRAYAAANPDTTIVAGHDPHQWASLPEHFA